MKARVIDRIVDVALCLTVIVESTPNVGSIVPVNVGKS